MEILSELTTQSWRAWTESLSDRIQQSSFETGPGGRHHAAVPSAEGSLRNVIAVAEEVTDTKTLENRARARRAAIQPSSRAKMSEHAWRAAALEETTSLFLQTWIKTKVGEDLPDTPSLQSWRKGADW